MITDALALALLTTGGLIVVYKKLPRKVRRYIEKYSLLTDILALVGIYLFLGGTLTALFAGAMAGLMISAMLHIVNNPNDFMYLYDFKNYIQDQFLKAKESLNEYGKQYRERKEYKLLEKQQASNV